MDAMNFASRIIAWQRIHGRHQLPWQQTRDPYKVWLSEIMLQQTQVSAVIPYYERFVARFPDVATLATAPTGDVMAHWAGLGYYARARNLHACAQAVMRDWQGRFPARAVDLATLPGIGRSTAGAIAAFCAGERAPILDGNVRRVLSRHFAIDADPGAAATLTRLWDLAQSLLPTQAACRHDPDTMASYTQGLMDLGATVCTRSAPGCAACPLAQSCIARAEDRVRDLPTPRTRRKQAEREVGVLIVHHGGKILLERRAPKGIWGGLWSFPEFDARQDPRSACEAIGITAASVEPMATFAHTFTHFRLMIHPWLVGAHSVGAHSLANGEATVGAHPLATDQAPAETREWICANTLNEQGMPAPVRKLLLEMVTAGLIGN